MYEKADVILMMIISSVAWVMTYFIGKGIVFILDISSASRADLINNMQMAVIILSFAVFGVLYFGIAMLVRSKPEDEK